ncbi:MAG: L-ribulose-5-phosphate 4-epimerase AraD [Planctomycetota bacterium]
MLDRLRQDVFEANIALRESGLVTLTWGNVSGLSDDRKLLVIKPSGVAYDRMRPEHMVVVDVDSGDVVEGDLRPSSDTPTHRVLYKAFDTIGGVTHTHSPKATAFAQARVGIDCLGTTHADHFYGPIPVTRPLTSEEVDAGYEANTGHVIAETFDGRDPLACPAVLLAGHAPFCWGSTPAASVNNAIALEAVAAMSLDSFALTRPAHPLENYVLEKHYARKHGPAAYYGQR